MTAEKEWSYDAEPGNHTPTLSDYANILLEGNITGRMMFKTMLYIWTIMI